MIDTKSVDSIYTFSLQRLKAVTNKEKSNARCSCLQILMRLGLSSQWALDRALGSCQQIRQQRISAAQGQKVGILRSLERQEGCFLHGQVPPHKRSEHRTASATTSLAIVTFDSEFQAIILSTSSFLLKLYTSSHLTTPAGMATKLPLRPTSAIRSLSKRRPSCTQPFSTTSPAAAISPYRKEQQSATKSSSRSSRRPATTAAAPAP
jgi:hypothetical protein